ncbi:MAG: L-threonylcarbamoyladenylate synthase [Minisyncoccota bacterium]
MEWIVLDGSNSAKAAQMAAEVLRSGGVVLYPTDTLYGLGADALSDEAVAKIFDIKGRDEGKPMHAIVADVDMAAKYTEVSGIARLLNDRLPKGQVTFITQKKEGLDEGISKQIETFGFRIPQHAFCIEMIRAFGGPITATSANASGKKPERSVPAILAQLGSGAAPIDLIIDGGGLPAREPSTVINLTHSHPLIVREGAVPASDVWSALQD